MHKSIYIYYIAFVENVQQLEGFFFKAHVLYPMHFLVKHIVIRHNRVQLEKNVMVGIVVEKIVSSVYDACKINDVD